MFELMYTAPHKREVDDYILILQTPVRDQDGEGKMPS